MRKFHKAEGLRNISPSVHAAGLADRLRSYGTPKHNAEMYRPPVIINARLPVNVGRRPKGSAVKGGSKVISRASSKSGYPGLRGPSVPR